MRPFSFWIEIVLSPISVLLAGRQVWSTLHLTSALQGPVLYGGLLDRCFTDYDKDHDSGNKLGIDFIKNISEYEPTPLAITSEAVRVCLHSDDCELDCATRNVSLSLMRGQTIPRIVTAVDQDNNQKNESFIRARYNVSSAKLGEGEGTTRTGSGPRYHFFTSDTPAATLILQLEGYREHSDLSSIGDLKKKTKTGVYVTTDSPT